LAQCRATVFGLGGTCYDNPAFVELAPRPRKSHRRHKTWRARSL
jgi:hypothetical protein